MTTLAWWQRAAIAGLALAAVGAHAMRAQTPPATAATGAQQQAPRVKRESARTIPSVDGRAVYEAYCAVCHGKDGTGKGPAAAALTVAPTDLTTLARRNNGAFDYNAVEQAVLGRERAILAHGTEDMPMWGPVFRVVSSDEARGRLMMSNLVKYIESIQVK